MAKTKAYVSNMGRFKSTKGVISTPKINKNGYSRVTIEKKNHSFHVVVVDSFLPPIEGKTEVNHKNKDSTNPQYNYLKHLERCTHSENILHSYATGRKSSAPKRSKPVKGRKVGTDEWVTYESSNDAARRLGLKQGVISACVKGRIKQTGGYEFQSLNEWTTLEGEEWKPTHGGYQISSLGRIRTRVGVEYDPTPTKSGYCEVQIQGTHYRVHRLVVDAFLPPPLPGQTEVNHKDLDPSNNCVTNLEWSSHAENIRHSYATNVQRESNAKRQCKPVKGRKDGGEWVSYPGGSIEAARLLGLNHAGISQACRKGHKCQGYEFEFDTPTEPELLEGEIWVVAVIRETP
jgi:hypothetical protein